MYRVPGTVYSTHDEEGGIVLDVQRDLFLRLNHTGSLIFQRIEQLQSESEISEALSQHFDVPRAVAERDTEEFLRALESRGLIHRT